MEMGLGRGHIVLDKDPARHGKGQRSPHFSAHVYCGHGRPSQIVLSSCLTSVSDCCDGRPWLKSRPEFKTVNK